MGKQPLNEIGSCHLYRGVQDQASWPEWWDAINHILVGYVSVGFGKNPSDQSCAYMWPGSCVKALLKTHHLRKGSVLKKQLQQSSHAATKRRLNLNSIRTNPQTKWENAKLASLKQSIFLWRDCFNLSPGLSITLVPWLTGRAPDSVPTQPLPETESSLNWYPCFYPKGLEQLRGWFWS